MLNYFALELFFTGISEESIWLSSQRRTSYQVTSGNISFTDYIYERKQLA